jgi:hypothetical protein
MIQIKMAGRVGIRRQSPESATVPVLAGSSRPDRVPARIGVTKTRHLACTRFPVSRVQAGWHDCCGP